MTKEEILHALSVGLCRIKYTKTNGEERIAVATRDPAIVPERPSSGSTRVESDTTVRYYEPEVSGWRSFLVENLISIERV